MSSNKIKVINCKNCGGSMEMFVESRKLQTLTCSYCGTVHDVQHDFNVLYKYSNTLKSNTPIKLGMKGKIKDVEFIIIGEIFYSDKLYPQSKLFATDYWIDYQLYSSTHGYATLSYENGHYIFSRRVRDIAPNLLNDVFIGNVVVYKNMAFKVVEIGQSYLYQVKGALSWRAKKGDKTAVVMASSPPFMISYEKSKNEIEYYFEEYIKPELIFKGFNIKDDQEDHRLGVHSAQLFDSPTLNALSKVSFVSMIFSIVVLLFLFVFGSGKEILLETWSGSDLQNGLSKEVNIKNISHLLNLQLKSSFSGNRWSDYDIKLLQDKKVIKNFSSELNLARKKSPKMSIYFKLPFAGKYNLKIASQTTKVPYIKVSLKESVWTLKYFFILFLISFGSYLFYLFKRYSFELKRN